MPRLSPIQPAFHGGEISPRAHGRVDLGAFKYGLAECRNFGPTPQGSLLMRAGTEHVIALASADPRTRIVSFPVAGRQDFVLELGQNALRAYDANGLVTGAGADGGYANLVQNGGFESGLAHWTVIAGAPTFWDGAVNLYAGNRIRQAVNALGAGVYRFSFFCYWVPVPATVRFRIGTTPGGAELLDKTYTGMLATFTEDVNVAGAGLIYIDITASQESLIDDIAFLSPATGQSGEVFFPTPWALDQLAQVQYVADTSLDRMILVHPNAEPRVLARSAANVWTFGAPVFTAKPIEWQNANWPGTVEIHNGRAYWGGTPNERNRVWASKSGTVFDFTRSVPPTPNEALDLKVATKGVVHWLREGFSLLVGTDVGAHYISGSTGQPLNGDVFTRRIPGVGSAGVQALDTGEVVLFVSSDRRRVHALKYNERQGWQAKDVLFFAEHLAESGVRAAHHLFAPDGMLVLELESGELAVCAYDPEQEIIAWWRLAVSSGSVRSAAVSRGPTSGHLWIEVQRDGALYLERLPLADTLLGLRYLDASVGKVADVNGVVAGLDHLDGDVRLVVNGEVIDTAVVGGEIALGADYANAAVTVGMPYRAKARTLPLEGGNPAGTSQGMAVSYAEIVVRLNESARPLVNGQRAGVKKAFAPDVEKLEELVTKDLRVSGKGVEEGGQIDIEQDMPFRTEVCTVFGSAEVSAV